MTDPTDRVIIGGGITGLGVTGPATDVTEAKRWAWSSYPTQVMVRTTRPTPDELRLQETYGHFVRYLSTKPN